MTYPAACSAVDELASLAARMRSWGDDEIRRSIAACQVRGWPFAQTALELVRLAATDGTEPGDLAARAAGKRKPTSYATVQPATDQLVALAVKMRGWAEPEVRHALSVCHGAGWGFGQAALELCRLMVIPDSEPRDLTAAARSPFARRTLGDRRG